MNVDYIIYGAVGLGARPKAVQGPCGMCVLEGPSRMGQVDQIVWLLSTDHYIAWS